MRKLPLLSLSAPLICPRMPNDQFSRLVRFAQRTGDRLIVTDPEGREPIVIMSFDEYEALLDGAMGPGKGFMLPSIAEDEDDELPEFVPPLEVIDEASDINVVALDTPSVQPIRAADTKSARVQTSRVHAQTPVAQHRTQPTGDPAEEQFYLEPL